MHGDDTNKPGDNAADDDDRERQEIADVQEQLDEEADGDGLAAEAGKGEETGLAEG